MVLSDRTIRQYIEEGRIKIDPYDPDELQPASVDLHFDKRVLVFRNNTAGYLDLRKDSVDLTEEVEIVAGCSVHASSRRVRSRKHARIYRDSE